MSQTSKLLFGTKFTCTYSIAMPRTMLRMVMPARAKSQSNLIFFRCQELRPHKSTNPPKRTICANLSRCLMPKSPKPGITFPGRHNSPMVSKVQIIGKSLVLLMRLMSATIYVAEDREKEVGEILVYH